MYTKLDTITTQYSRFVKNQVLTEGQLNQFLEYFEDQDRLSRIGLSGVGIVCGFEVALNKNENTITITQGIGITTDGDLLYLLESKVGDLSLTKGKKTYTHYKPFDDRYGKYDRFLIEGSQIDLIEVVSEEDILAEDSIPLKLTAEQIKNKVVLLYLENYPKQGDLCTALDCDNQGQLLVSKLRVLLVSEENARYIASKESDLIYNKHNWYDVYQSLPQIEVGRDILSSRNTTDYRRLKKIYYNLIRASRTQKIQRLSGSGRFASNLNEQNMLSKLSMGLDEIFHKFKRSKISQEIFQLLDVRLMSIPADFQYLYDTLKDLVDTYNEIKELLLHINVECAPDINSFPKHLMLGKLEKKPQPQGKILRHRFYKSPILGNECTISKKVNSLLDRVEQILKQYQKKNKGKEIKITPSKLNGELGNQAIPFYYNITSDFLNSWSFEKYQNLRQTSNLSYHAENFSDTDSVREPLYYNLDDYNFLRIEGVQGKSYKDAFDQVMDLKKRFGLNFDVKVLPLGKPNQRINMADYQCEFEDLEVLLQAWKKEQECVLKNVTKFISGFKLEIKEKDDNDGGIIIGNFYVPKDLYLHNYGFKESGNWSSALEYKTIHSEEAKSLKKTPSASVKGYVSNVSITPINSSVVLENLIQEENSLGFHMFKAFEENKGGCESVNDILKSTKDRILPLLQSELWESHPNAKNFILHEAPNLLINAYKLNESIPISILQIDPNSILKYQVTLQKICNLSKKLKNEYQDYELSETQNNLLELQIQQLANVCCLGKKIEILQKEIEKRKENILKRLQLSEFVKQHPGLRHQAGVPVGGTFVMAYLSDNEEGQSTYDTVRLELDFLNKPFNNEEGVEFNGGLIQLWDEKVSAAFTFSNQVTREANRFQNEVVLIGRTIEDTLKNLVEFLNYKWKMAGVFEQCRAFTKDNSLTIEIIDRKVNKEEYFIQFFNPKITGNTDKVFFKPNEIIIENITSKNTVIADFALPYMCCSDCTPVNFVVPKEPVYLSLPASYVCLNEATEPLPFTVKPEDGEVTADVKEGLSAGVVQDENGAYWFDAKKLNPGLIGRPIRFLVDNEETTAVITVYETPQAVITASPDNFMYDDMQTEVRVAFEVSGSGLTSNTEFEWDFDDGSDSSKDKPDEKGVVWHTYKLPVNENNTVAPRIKVSNGSCTQDIEMDGIQFDEPADVTLEIQDRYCYDNSLEQQEIRVLFTNINPADGKIEIIGENPDGLMSIDQSSKEFVIINPWEFKLFGTPIGFALNGKPTQAKITIGEIPRAEFKHEIDRDNEKLILNNLSDNGKKYIWEIGSETLNRKNRTKVVRDLDTFDNSVFVSLIAINDCDSDTFDDTIILEIDDAVSCITSTLARIKKNRAGLNRDSAVSIINSDIIEPTRNAYDTVINNHDNFLSGNNNSSFSNFFGPFFWNFEDLIKEYSQNTNSSELDFLRHFYEAQIKLFFDVLNCQEENLLIEIKQLVDEKIEMLSRQFKLFQSDQIVIDQDNSLKTFLENYANSIENDNYIKQAIKNKLITFIL